VNNESKEMRNAMKRKDARSATFFSPNRRRKESRVARKSGGGEEGRAPAGASSLKKKDRKFRSITPRGGFQKRRRERNLTTKKTPEGNLLAKRVFSKRGERVEEQEAGELPAKSVEEEKGTRHHPNRNTAAKSKTEEKTHTTGVKRSEEGKISQEERAGNH